MPKLLNRLSLEIKSLILKIVESTVLVFSVPSEVPCDSPEVAQYMLTAQTGFACRGFVITVAHGLTDSKVCIASRNGIREARLEGIDNRWDLAFLSVPRDWGLLRDLELETHSSYVGELVIVVGMNRGSLNPYAALGMVSSEGVSVRIGGRVIEGALQVHTYVPRGTSGSPVVSARGRVLGIVVGMDYGGSVAYAVPSIVVERDLGLVLRGVSPSDRPRLGIKVVVTSRGLMVMHVDKNSIAYEAGILIGDVIKECYVCGERIDTRDLWGLWKCVDEAAVCRDSIEFRIVRGDREKIVVVPLT